MGATERAKAAGLELQETPAGRYWWHEAEDYHLAVLITPNSAAWWPPGSHDAQRVDDEVGALDAYLQHIAGRAGVDDAPTDTDLAAQIASHPRWRWAPGMLAIRANGCEYRVAVVQPAEGDDGHRIANGYGDWGSFEGARPDFTDPATVGCLLAALVTADPGLGWSIGRGPDIGWVATSSLHYLTADSAGAALAEALLLVWGAP